MAGPNKLHRDGSPILRSREEYFSLSNMYHCEFGVEFEGDVYATSEHAFQAAKAAERSEREICTRGCSCGDDPLAAKKRVRLVQLRSDWDAGKIKFASLKPTFLSGFY